jgi:hypothetical protein
VDFSRNLNFQLRVLPGAGASAPAHPAPNAAQLFNLTGPIRSPKLQPVNPSASRATEQETTEQRN